MVHGQHRTRIGNSTLEEELNSKSDRHTATRSPGQYVLDEENLRRQYLEKQATRRATVITNSE